MKTIAIEDDVYAHLVKHTSVIGEDASSILRRLLGISRGNGMPPKAPSLAPSPSKIDECLASSRVLAERDATGRFLAILAWLYQRHGDDFEKILLIEGRKRKYFSLTEEELEASGNSVMPQRIPDSRFWVITNNDTPKKARMLGDVLNVLGYGRQDAEKVRQALD